MKRLDIDLKKVLLSVVNIYKYVGVGLILASFVLLLLNFSPELWYSIDSGAFDSDKSGLVSTVSAKNLLADETKESSYNNYSAAKQLPAIDYSLPTSPTLIINKIGVNGEIRRGGGDEMLDLGVWAPSNFEIDPSLQQPIVLTSHRYGLISWSSDYRTNNSFLDITKLIAGDKISIIYGQRAYEFTVTGLEVNTSLYVSSDDDLILVTCKYFRSSERIILRAKASWYHS